MLDGSPVSSLAQWKCRREELAALLEEFELGEKPRKTTRRNRSAALAQKPPGSALAFAITSTM